MTEREGPTADELVERLRHRGYRLTDQRRMILEQIADARGRIVADAIHRAVAARYPSVNVSTVYRTLDLLERLGYLVHHHDGAGIVYHHAHVRGHVHLSCLGCGHVAAIVDDQAAAEFARRLEGSQGFVANLAHSTIFGVCRACAAAGKSPGGPHRHSPAPETA